MCGITGWMDYARDLGRQGLVLDERVATMACRGPDAQGTWTAHMWHLAIGGYQ